MSDDPTPPILDYQHSKPTPRPRPTRFSWSLFLGGIVLAISSPILAGIFVSALPTNSDNRGIAIGILGLGVAGPLVAAIGSLFRPRRRAFGIGVLLGMGVFLSIFGACAAVVFKFH